MAVGGGGRDCWTEADLQDKTLTRATSPVLTWRNNVNSPPTLIFAVRLCKLRFNIFHSPPKVRLKLAPCGEYNECARTFFVH